MIAGNRTSYFLIFILAIIWGSSFILMKYALVVYTPAQVGGLRIFVAFMVMLPIVFRNIHKIEKKKWKYLAASGFLGNGIPSILFPLAETRISSSLAGFLNSLTPIFTLIVGVLFFGMRTGRNRIAGVTIGLLGAILMILGETGSLGLNTTNAFALYVVLAAVCYAVSVNILRFRLAELDPVTITAFALFCIGIPMGIYLFSGDFLARTASNPEAPESILYIVLLGLLSTALSTILFNRLIKISGALSATSVTYLIPIVAIFWGVLDNESLGIAHLAGLIAILSGVYLINRK